MTLKELIGLGRPIAFVPIILKGVGYTLGIATKDEPGYIPASRLSDDPTVGSPSWRTFSEANAAAAKLNRLVLKLDPRAAAEIVLSSMRGPG